MAEVAIKMIFVKEELHAKLPMSIRVTRPDFPYAEHKSENSNLGQRIFAACHLLAHVHPERPIKDVFLNLSTIPIDDGKRLLNEVAQQETCIVVEQ
jgi:hypothetical protein